jgi:uncharacterized membrane protein YraQ (UPF0718 family)/copper chaperone CopZ
LAIWLELSPWLLLGAALAGLLHIFAPAEWIKHHLGADGVRSVVKAVLVGTPMPLCSCGVIPAALGLRKDGASKGASLAFLISTPQTGVDSVAVSAAFLGWPFAIFKLAAAAVTGVVGGWLGDRIEPETEPTAPTAAKACENAEKRNWRDGFAHADELLQMIGFWLVVGVLASALITVLLPADGLANFAWTQGLAGMFVVLLIALPLYVCATASVPIAAALVAAGLPGGTALVFLMAGPATNVATIGAVYSAFGKRLTVLYLATVIVGSIALGMLFESIWGLSVAERAHHAHHEHAGPLAMVAGGVLAILLLRHAVTWAKLKMHSANEASRVIAVGGMSCGGCANKVSKALQEVPGVTGVDADADADSVTVYGNPDPEAVNAAITEAGFKLL